MFCERARQFVSKRATGGTRLKGTFAIVMKARTTSTTIAQPLSQQLSAPTADKNTKFHLGMICMKNLLEIILINKI